MTMSLAVAKKGAITSTGPSAWRPAVVAIPILLVLAVLPSLVDPYQTVLLTYGLIMAIAALGFNLLLGYTGLLSFGNSAYFGAGAYTVAFIVRDLGAQSMELCIVGGLLGALLISALFGFVCVRHTRIFFSILTLALSQVLWSLAFKFFWVTGGTDGIRVASAKLTLLGGLVNFAGPGSFQRFVFAYYYYVLGLFALATVIMWVVVHSPFAGEIVFMSVLGGFRTFTGPIVGAVVFNYLKTYAVASTEYWQFLLGVVLVVLVLALPSGIVGTAARLAARFTRGTS